MFTYAPAQLVSINSAGVEQNYPSIVRADENDARTFVPLSRVDRSNSRYAELNAERNAFRDTELARLRAGEGDVSRVAPRADAGYTNGFESIEFYTSQSGWRLDYETEEAPATDVDWETAVEAEVSAFGPNDDTARAKLRQLIVDRNAARTALAARDANVTELANVIELANQLWAAQHGQLWTAQHGQIAFSDPRLSDAWEEAGRVATEEGYCSEYDKMAERLGGPRREVTYDVEVALTVYVTVQTDAHSEDDAELQVGDWDLTDFESHIRNAGHGGIGVADVKVRGSSVA